MSLVELVVALSHALDFMEIDFLGGVTNHSKRVAYIALRVARESGLDEETVFDAVTLAILHDNGIGVAFQKKEEAASSAKAGGSMTVVDAGAAHCVAGQENLVDYPFLTNVGDALLYHHENWDGSGIFGKSGDAVPLLSQIIHLADMVELSRRLGDADYDSKRELRDWIDEWTGKLFSPELVRAFTAVSASPAFWLDLKDEFVSGALRRLVPHFDREMDFSEIRGVTKIFSRIIDSKSRFTSMHSSELSERAGRMACYYGFDAGLRDRFLIAADLHDVGKLAVGNAILDKPGKLDPPEIDVIQRHTYYTRVSLQSIAGFEEITEWASNHHEKLDGSGYPYGKPAADLDFNSRLLSCLDIYQALTEERPYRAALSHERTLSIMSDMAGSGKIDGAIVADIDKVFAAG